MKKHVNLIGKSVVSYFLIFSLVLSMSVSVRQVKAINRNGKTTSHFTTKKSNDDSTGGNDGYEQYEIYTPDKESKQSDTEPAGKEKNTGKSSSGATITGSDNKPGVKKEETSLKGNNADNSLAEDTVTEKSSAADSGVIPSESQSFDTALAGVLADKAAIPSSGKVKEIISSVPDSPGIWIPQRSRADILESINNVSACRFYINKNGYLEKDTDSDIDPNKSKTFSDKILSLISGKERIVLTSSDFFWNVERSMGKIYRCKIDADSVTIKFNSSRIVILNINKLNSFDSGSSDKSLFILNEIFKSAESFDSIIKNELCTDDKNDTTANAGESGEESKSAASSKNDTSSAVQKDNSVSSENDSKTTDTAEDSGEIPKIGSSSQDVPNTDAAQKQNGDSETTGTSQQDNSNADLEASSGANESGTDAAAAGSSSSSEEENTGTDRQIGTKDGKAAVSASSDNAAKPNSNKDTADATKAAGTISKGTAKSGNEDVCGQQSSSKSNDKNKSNPSALSGTKSPGKTANSFCLTLYGIIHKTETEIDASSAENVLNSIPDGNGIWIPPYDRDRILAIINSKASKNFCCDKTDTLKRKRVRHAIRINRLCTHTICCLL